MKIAIFDSGMGGLSVLHLALQKLPQENFLYFADNDHVPYGTKTKEEIISYVEEAIEFMITQDVKAIVVACNTATSAAIQEMRERYTLPIIGMEPAVKKAVDFYGDKRILVIATPMTVKGKKLHDLIDKVDREHLVDLIALPKLVTFAEEGIFSEEAVLNYLQEELGKFDFANYSSIVLGCTHFNYFKDSLREILPNNMIFLDGNEGTMNKLISELQNRNLLEAQENPKVEFYYSARKVEEQKELERLKDYLKRLNQMLEIR